MPLEPLEFLSAFLLWSASVPTGFHHVEEGARWRKNRLWRLILKAYKIGREENNECDGYWRLTYK